MLEETEDHIWRKKLWKRFNFFKLILLKNESYYLKNI